MPRDLKAALSFRPGAGALPVWDPEPGDVLTGRLTGYGVIQGPRGPVRVAELEEEDGGPRLVWLNAPALLSLFAALQPVPGEALGLAYHGTHAGGARSYDLQVDRPGAPVSFLPLGGESEDAPGWPESLPRAGRWSGRLSSIATLLSTFRGT